MKDSRAVIAMELKLALEAGLIDRSEIVRWADEILISEAYDDLVAEISLSSGKSNADLVALLDGIAFPDQEFAGFRKMLGRMHAALEAEPARLDAFTHILDRFFIRHCYTVPKDLSFIMGVRDDYELAEMGHVGSTDEIRNQLLQDLAPFRDVS